MPTNPLPDNPDLEQLETNAELLRDLVRAGDAGTIELVREFHPRFAELDLPTLALADAQLALARHHELPSWPKLRAHVLLIQGLSRSPHAVPLGDAAPEDELVKLACLTYGGDDRSRVAAAAVLLAEQPDLPTRSVFAAAVAGDVEATAAHLAADRMLARQEGGPFRWTALTCLAYSRLESGDPVAVARLLLDAGADPNAGYLWDGLTSPFTVLTGVIGDGEGDQPPHPQWQTLARLLLERGADPNDDQAIYNRGLGGSVGDDTEYLSLLLEFGLGRGAPGPWRRALEPALPTPAELLGEALQAAVENGCVERTRVLLAGGADPNGHGQHPAFGGRTAIEGAVRNGTPAIVELLVAAGADIGAVDPVDAFIGACLVPDPAAVAAARTADPAIVERAIAAEPGLVGRAADLGRATALAPLVELGWDVNHCGYSTALHNAAFRGDVDAIRSLLALGADLSIEDPSYHATPKGWAEHAGHPEAAALL